MTIMLTPSGINFENPLSLHTNKIVRRLDEFPELLEALRDGDLLTVRFLWAQLCDCDGRRNPTRTPQAAMKAH
jgi:hypothetical protein